MKKLLIPLTALTVVLTTAICVKSNANREGDKGDVRDCTKLGIDMCPDYFIIENGTDVFINASLLLSNAK